MIYELKVITIQRVTFKKTNQIPEKASSIPTKFFKSKIEQNKFNFLVNKKLEENILRREYYRQINSEYIKERVN